MTTRRKIREELGAGGEGVLIAIFVLLAVAIVIAGYFIPGGS